VVLDSALGDEELGGDLSVCGPFRGKSRDLDLGESARGNRRILPLTGGTFIGPELSGTLLPGASADWQTVLPDGTAFGDIRYTLQTDAGELLYVQSRSVRHSSAEVLARLGRGEDVDASEYTFRTSTKIEAAANQLDWLNRASSSASAAVSPMALSTRPTSSSDLGPLGVRSGARLSLV
jgi:Protein of unknown function (DUF3237)